VLDGLFKVYAYVFFFLRGTVKDDRTPNSALAMLGVLEVLAVATLKFALDIWRGNLAYPHPRLQVIGVILTIYLANYVLLIRGGLYRRFDHEFSHYRPRTKRLLRAAVILAIAVVVAAFFTLRGAAFERVGVHT